MSHDDVIPRESVRYGAYVCLRLGDAVDRRALQAAAVPALAARLGLASEFEAREPLPRAAIAFLRRLDGRAGDIADDDVLQADGVIHVAAATRDPVAEFCDEVTRLLAPALKPRILGGVVRPLAYTGAAMNNFAYAHRVLQRPGHAMPHAFLLPMSKTAAWWAKDWMERHTYFLPRYDDAGRMTAEGRDRTCARGRVRLRDVLRVRGRRRPDIPPRRGESARRAQKPRMAIRTRRAHVARSARRDVAGRLHTRIVTS